MESIPCSTQRCPLLLQSTGTETHVHTLKSTQNLNASFVLLVRIMLDSCNLSHCGAEWFTCIQSMAWRNAGDCADNSLQYDFNVDIKII